MATIYTNAETKLPQLLADYLEDARTPVVITGGDAGTNVITTATPHRFIVGRRVWFPALTGGSPLVASEATLYYVRSTPTASTFTLSATAGGAELDITTAITAGTVQRETGLPAAAVLPFRQMQTTGALTRPLVLFFCTAMEMPHPSLQRLLIEVALHAHDRDTTAEQENAWLAAVRRALNDTTALNAYLAGLSESARTGWRINKYRLTEGGVEGDGEKKTRVRRTLLAISMQATETAGI